MMRRIRFWFCKHPGMKDACLRCGAVRFPARPPEMVSYTGTAKTRYWTKWRLP